MPDIMRDNALATSIPASLDEYRSLHRLAQRRLREAEASCTWRTVPRKSIRSFHAWAFRGPTGNEPHPAAKDAEVRICEAGASTASGGRPAVWHVVRIGPFVTDGNGTRVELLSEGLYEAMGLREGDEIAESEAGPRWLDDDTVAHMPDFHVHHFVEIPPEQRYAGFVRRLRERRVRYEPVPSEACDPIHFYSSTVHGPAGFTSDWLCSQLEGCNGQWAHEIIPEPYAYVFEPGEVSGLTSSLILEDFRPPVRREGGRQLAWR